MTITSGPTSLNLEMVALGRNPGWPGAMGIGDGAAGGGLPIGYRGAERKAGLWLRKHPDPMQGNAWLEAAALIGGPVNAQTRRAAHTINLFERASTNMAARGYFATGDWTAHTESPEDSDVHLSRRMGGGQQARGLYDYWRALSQTWE